MRAISEAALERARERWFPMLEERRGSELSFGVQAFSLADLFRSNSRLTHALGDLGRSEDDRAMLALSILRGRVGDELAELVAGMVREHWAGESDLADAVEAIGLDSVLLSARHNGVLTELEGEIYEIRRLLADARSLRIALSDSAVAVDRRVKLTCDLAAHKVSEEALALAIRAVERAPMPTLASTLGVYLDRAAELARKTVASVRVASPMTREQEERLARILSARYGREISVHVAIDPEVIGGMRIHVGDEVLDATLATRIQGVKDALMN